ncbi:restriction endonuclease subunit S [Lactiplantibacillus pentosus]|uniref:restriction endonuclease subunit S n=1 Tax=Lactiplantibacillus pentosus TaxID=1589 RepID=UPI001F3AD334|nr:restriction endonuclease subunit S [Lactiplantibacillus pentosus]MCE6031910.1 restriction endonuclease subunit S [Lactiplantibacillus pentosus]
MKDNQAKYPQLRFKGFTDPWEQCKLRGILAERNDQITETNEYPLMSFVQGKGVTPKGKRYNRSFLVKDVDKKYKKTELGDFIYSSNNLETGSIGFNRTGKAVISPVYSIFKSKREQESQFIGIMSARKDFIFKMIRFRQGVVYGQWRIHESDFLNIDIRIPSYEEQQSIICFFEKLNKAITLHQRKLAKLKELKQGYLQKLFPQNGSKLPQLRFAGFADAWEQRKLGQLFEKNLEKNKNGEFDATRTISIATMRFKKEGNGAAESSLATYKVLRVGDIAYEGHTSKQFAFGRFVLNDIGDGIMSPRFTTLRPTSKRPIFFWKQFIHYEPIMRHLLVRSTKNGTMMNELVIPDLEKESLLVPTEAEQKQIGSFFKQLDNTITLHQRKLEKLQELKKGYLQKMFC